MPSNDIGVERRTDRLGGDRLEGHGFIELDGTDEVVVTVSAYVEPGEPRGVCVRLVGDGWSTGVALSPSRARELAENVTDAAAACDRAP